MIHSFQNPLEYIFFSHPKPWSINIGTIGEPIADEGVIKVPFKITRPECKDTEFWNNGEVYLEITDNDGRIVFAIKVNMSSIYRLETFLNLGNVDE